MFKLLNILTFCWKELLKEFNNETKEQKGVFLEMLLGTLGVSLLGNLLTGKGIVRAGYGAKRAAYGLKKEFWFHLIL